MPEPITIHLDCPDVFDDVVEVHGGELTEAIAAPYRASLELPLPDPDLDAVRLLGANATLVMARGGIERRVCGLITSVSEGDEALDAARPRSTVVLEPAFALGAQSRDSRIFQDMTAVDIVLSVLNDKVLAPYERSARAELDETYETLECCVQYAETDRDFVMRLLEEAGVAFRFDHEGDVETLVLVDANGSYPSAECTESPLPYVAAGFAVGDRDGLELFRRVETHTSTKVVLNEHDWTQGSIVIEDEQGGADARARERERYEHGHGRSLRLVDYDDGVARYQAHNAGTQKKVRLEAAMRDERRLRGLSHAVGLGAGHTISVAGHPDPVADGDFLIVETTHRFGFRASAAAEAVAYENELVVIPLETPYRPARATPRPRVTSALTAVVTGPNGEEIHVDKHGRIKVRFFWDRESPADETSSAWVRVKQEWAGPGWGHYWVPRIGMEVVVQFIDGDPDRPLVTGAVYDADRAPPYPLPDEKTKSTIKSESSIGGGGNNELRFEDKAGEEQVYTHAQKDYDEVVENDHSTLVHHDQKNVVDGHQEQIVHGDQTERVDVDQSLSVGANRKVHIEGSFEETVDGTETREVTGDVTEDFGASEARDVSGSLDESIGGSETRDIGASQAESIGASHALTIAGDHSRDIAAALSESVDGGITTVTPGAYEVTTGGPWTLDAAGGITAIVGAGTKILAPGGVTRVDFEWKLEAGTNNKMTVLCFEFYGDKIEATGMELATAGMKVTESGSANYKSGTVAALRVLRARVAAFKKGDAAIDGEPGPRVET